MIEFDFFYLLKFFVMYLCLVKICNGKEHKYEQCLISNGDGLHLLPPGCVRESLQDFTVWI